MSRVEAISSALSGTINETEGEEGAGKGDRVEFDAKV